MFSLVYFLGVIVLVRLIVHHVQASPMTIYVEIACSHGAADYVFGGD